MSLSERTKMPSTSSQLPLLASRVHRARIGRPDGARGRPPAVTARVAPASSDGVRGRPPPATARAAPASREGACGPHLPRWHARLLWRRVRPLPPATVCAAAHQQRRRPWRRVRPLPPAPVLAPRVSWRRARLLGVGGRPLDLASPVPWDGERREERMGGVMSV